MNVVLDLAFVTMTDECQIHHTGDPLADVCKRLRLAEI